MEMGTATDGLGLLLIVAAIVVGAQLIERLMKKGKRKNG
jgi:hypothetical protein